MRLSVLLLAIPLVGCARNSSPPAAGHVVTGTVAYRERMVLPPDAVVQVQLMDVSRQDVAASLVAETTVSPSGRQVPLAFELRYDSSRVEPSHAYAVRATIRSEGRLIFTTTTVAHVITRGHPTRVDLLLWRVPAAAAPALARELWETSWVLEDIGGTGVIDGARATLEFPERGKTAGRASCNRFFGTVAVTGPAIAFGALGATRMACAEAVMNQESRYLKALQDAERYTIDGTVLMVYSKGMDRPLRFTQNEPR